MSTEQTETMLYLSRWIFAFVATIIIYLARNTRPVKFISRLSPARIFAGVAIIVGLGAVITSGVVYKNSQIPSSYRYTNGVVRERKQIPYVTYRCSRFDCKAQHTSFTEATVDYVVDAKQYSFTLTVNADLSVYRPGSSIRIAYNSQNPSLKPIDASEGSEHALGPVLMVLGGIFALVGALFLYSKRDIKTNSKPTRSNKK